MEYFEITFSLSGLSELTGELLPHLIEPLGFEGFTEGETGILGYIPSSLYDRKALISKLREQHIPVDCFTEVLLPDKNWNEVWEKNFEPVVIDDRCLIRAPFHQVEKKYPFDIIIEPKMSFGTGHHATTSLMVSEMLQLDMKGKSVLDAGCGTGILAILAEKLGAADVSAVDIDEWSYRNASENTVINNCSNITLVLGNASDFTGTGFHFILANINLNILKSGLLNFTSLLRPQGQLLMSGIFISDMDSLKTEAEKYGLVFEYVNTLSNWAMARFKKL